MASRYLKEVEWQILHAINLYIFRNGRDGEQPILVHVPPEKKKNMKSIMKVIQERVKFPIGYATQLYNMSGLKVRLINELEQYHCYVAASNYDKHFISTQYGRKRSPLIVLNRDSKHIRFNGRTDNYDRILKKKLIGEELPECIFYNHRFNANDNTNAQDPPQRENTFTANSHDSQPYLHTREEFLVDTSPVCPTVGVTDKLQRNETWSYEGRHRKFMLPNTARRTEIQFEPSDMDSEWIVGDETIACDRISDNNFDPRPDSKESLNNSRYLEIFKQAKCRKCDSQEVVSSRSYSVLTNPSNNGSLGTNGINSNRLPSGNQMLVLPPPPAEFQDDRFLPEINPFSNLHRQPSETYWSFERFRGLKQLEDPPFVLLEGHLRPQLRKPVQQQLDNIIDNSQSEEHISRCMQKMIQGSKVGFKSLLNVQPGPVPSRREAIRPTSHRRMNSSIGENVTSRITTPYRNPYTNASHAFKIQDDPMSYQFDELGQPSFETFVIHNRIPERTNNTANSGQLRTSTITNAQRSSYPDPHNNSSTSDKNIKEILHRNPSAHPKSKAKLIVRNGYTSS